MCEPSNVASNAAAVFGGSLVVGNHDSVTLFGVHAQNDLKDCIGKISSIVLRDAEDLNASIADISAEAERIESRAKSPARFILGRERHRREIEEARKELSSRIEKAALSLKMQQIRLLKEVKLLEKLEDALASCSTELEHCLEEGKTALAARSPCGAGDASATSFLSENSAYEAWYSRLEKRIEDLAVSRTLSLQSQVQIQLLRESNMLMIDRIVGGMSTLAAICQSRVSIEQGADLVKDRLETQGDIQEFAERRVKDAY